MVTNLRFAWRQLKKATGFTIVAVATLALCIGANLTIFAVIDSVLLKPLPFPSADRLVIMFNSYPKAGLERGDSSLPNYYGRRGKIDAFEKVAAFRYDNGIIGDADSNETADILRASPDFLATLGVNPALGREFTDDEMNFQAHHVTLLTDSYWRERFNSDPNILGREIRVNGFSKTIIGVLPPEFRFLSSKAKILLPLSSSPEKRGINNLYDIDCQMIARLKNDATIGQAISQIATLNAAQGKDFPYADLVSNSGFHTVVDNLHEDHVKSIRPTLLLLQIGVFFLLLIGGVNLVNLLLVRASSRVKELAVRQSLGASRRQLISQIVTETVLLTLIGAVCGLLVADAGIHLLLMLGADQLPLGTQIALHPRSIAVVLAGSIVLGIGVAMPVVWFYFRSDLAKALQSETRGGGISHAAQRLRHGFIIAQIGIAFVLLTGASLLSVSLRRAMSVSPGFQPDQVQTAHISVLHRKYLDNAPRIQFVDRLVERLQNQAGITAAGVISTLPLEGKDGGKNKRIVTVEGQAPNPGAPPRPPYVYYTAGDYFSAMRIPLRSGKFLEGAEARRNDRVCVVDEIFARQHWPNENAVGKRIFDSAEIKDGNQPFTIIGVVGSVKQTELTASESNGAIYFPYNHNPSDVNRVYAVVRTAFPPQTFGPILRKLVQEIEPELPIVDLRTMEVRMSDTLVARKSPALLAGTFAAVALVLAAIGTYGVLSYSVTQRRGEIGVRMALGALPGQIRAQFLQTGLRLLAAGTLLGLAGAWIAGRAMQAILFDLPQVHLATLAATALIMALVSLIACWIPARRASQVDPMVVLRAE